MTLTRRLSRVATFALAALFAAGSISCSSFTRRADSAGRLSIRNEADVPTFVKAGFASGYYSYDELHNLTVVLVDGPAEKPTQAVTIRMFWQPLPGRTPIDSTATNATIHYMIFPGDDGKLAGVYSGAGFVYPNQYPGDKSFTGSVWQSNLLLRDATDGFKDLLGPAQLQGTFTAKRDDTRVTAMIRTLNSLVRERVGYPRFVQADSND